MLPQETYKEKIETSKSLVNTCLSLEVMASWNFSFGSSEKANMLTKTVKEKRKLLKKNIKSLQNIWTFIFSYTKKK